jgi:hypothetical protein
MEARTTLDDKYHYGIFEVLNQKGKKSIAVLVTDLFQCQHVSIYLIKKLSINVLIY